MSDKNYAEVLIDGKIYTLGGAEDQQYLQKVAGYITEKMNQLKRQDRFSRQSQEYQDVMVALNIADDYFKALAKVDAVERRCEEMEKETYSLKHELVMTQMSLERREKELEDAQDALRRMREQSAETPASVSSSGRRKASGSAPSAFETAAGSLTSASGTAVGTDPSASGTAAADSPLSRTTPAPASPQVNAAEKARDDAAEREQERTRILEDTQRELQAAKEALAELQMKEQANRDEILKLRAFRAATAQSQKNQYNNRR